MPQPLSNNDREALVIRWRNLLRLALLDYFNVSQDYSRLIVKEILDMEQAALKSFASANNIHVAPRGFPEQLFKDIAGLLAGNLSNRLEGIHRELGGLRDVFRNPETHELSLPMPPLETTNRCLRRLKELVELLDPQFLRYAREEQSNFVRIGYFYYEIVAKERVSYKDEIPYNLLAQLKQRSDDVEIKAERGRTIKGRIQNEERSPDTIVKLIEAGDLETGEFRQFIEGATRWA